MKKRQLQLEYFRMTIIYVLTWFFFALLLLFVISPIGYSLFMSIEASVIGVLKGYRNWYFTIDAIIFIEFILSIVMFILITIDHTIKATDDKYSEISDDNMLFPRMAFIRGSFIVCQILLLVGILEFIISAFVALFIGRRKKFDFFVPFGGNILITNLLFGMTCLFAIVFCENIKPFENYQYYDADIVAVNEGLCETGVVQFNPDIDDEDMNPMGGKYKTYALQYSTIFRDNENCGSWTDLYIPKSMNFTLNPDHLYSENASTEWNCENASVYFITYTPNSKLIVDIKEQ